MAAAMAAPARRTSSDVTARRGGPAAFALALLLGNGAAAQTAPPLAGEGRLQAIAPATLITQHGDALKQAGATGLRPFDNAYATFALSDEAALPGLQQSFGDELRLIHSPRVIIGAAPPGAGVEALYDREQREAGAEIAPALVFAPDVLDEIGRGETSGDFTLQVFDRALKVRSVEIEPPALEESGAGSRYRLHLDAGHAFLEETLLDPLDPASPRVLAGDIIIGPDVYRLAPLDGSGRAAMLRLEGAAALGDHDRSYVGAQVAAAPPPRCDAGPDSVIRVGWAISPEAAAALERANRASVFAAEPTQIAGSMTHLNDILDHHGIEGVNFAATPLFTAPQRWRGFSKPEGGYDFYFSRNTASALYTQFEPVRREAALQQVDIVVLIVDSSEDSCGQATILASPDAAVAFVNQRCMFTPRFALSHEIGHVVGGCHEPKYYVAPLVCGPASEPRKDRFAWRSSAARTGDTMASWDALRPNDPDGFVREAHFSSAVDAFGSGAKPGATAEMNLTGLLAERIRALSAFGRCRTPRP
jgi:hypothetical protein